MRSMVLAALAAAPLLLGALPAEAGDWRRHHNHHRDHGSGIILGPGISLQFGYFGPRHFHSPPRYGHDVRRYWHKPKGHWHNGRRHHRQWGHQWHGHRDQGRHHQRRWRHHH